MTTTEPIDLYHRTSASAAAAILRECAMTSRENTQEAYFSTVPDGQAVGYGTTVVHVRVPAHLAELDDEFPDGELHYRVRASPTCDRSILSLARNRMAKKIVRCEGCDAGPSR